jgi:hypothetical protein
MSDFSFASLIPSAVSAFGNLLQSEGQADTNTKNEEIAQANRDFQERMSNTAYQRATKDMIAAGLSPMLAYSQGGASSPAGSTAVMQNKFGNAAAGARDVASMSPQIENIKATTQRELTQADLNRASVEEVNARTVEQRAETAAREHSSAPAQFGAAPTFRVAQRGAELDKLMQDTGLSAQHVEHLKEDIRSKIVGQKLTRAQVLDTMKSMEKKAAEIFLHEMEMPGARNKAHSDSTFWGENIRPYLKDAGSVANSAASVGSLFRKGRSYIFGGQ